MPKLNRHTLLASLNSFAAAMLALYIAFALDLPRPYWAMMTVYIVSNPFAGAVRSKAVYRLAGTLIGATAMLVLVPNLVNEPLVLSLAISLWVGGCLIVSLLNRTPSSYMLLLAGYTAALIGFPSVNQPDAVFDIARARVEEIGLGIVCATAMHSLFFPRPVGGVLQARLAQWVNTADSWLLDIVVGGDMAERAKDRRQLAAAASDIRIQATHLPFDTSRLRETQAAVRALHERMLLMIPILSGIGDRRQALAETGALPPTVQARFDEAAAWVRGGGRYDEGRDLVAAIRKTAAVQFGEDWRDLLVQSLLARLDQAITALSECHALLAHIDAPDVAAPSFLAPAVSEALARPLHSDIGLAVRSGFTCVVGTMITCALWIGTGWQEGAAAASMVAVFCALFATLDDPVPAIVMFSVVSIVTLALSALYVFGVFQAIDGFPLLATVLFPPLFLIGLFIGDPTTTMKGMALGVTFGSALAIQETVNANFATYLNGNLAIYVGAFVAVFVTRAMRSMTAEVSVQRLLRLTWAAIARLAGRGGAEDPAGFAALLVDRLALLTPRLAFQEPGGRTVAEGALRDLRVAMNMVALWQARKDLRPNDRARLRGVMDGLEAHFAQLARGGASRPAPDTLLPRLDEALSGLAAWPDARDRDAALGLVGLRRNLFPGAAPFIATQEQPA